VEFTASTIAELSELLEAGDILIDGGNSNFQDDVRHAQMLKAKGIRYLDVGTSGRVWGLDRGYCMMIGGDQSAAIHLDPHLKIFGPRDRKHSTHLHLDEKGQILLTAGTISTPGPAGSGHFVKIVHNGIEYGLMQAYPEGIDVLKGVGQESIPAERRYRLDLAGVARVMAQRKCGLVVVVRFNRYFFGGRSRTGILFWACPRFWGGQMDAINAAIEEAVPSARVVSCFVCAFPLASGGCLCGQNVICHAQAVWWAPEPKK
jgi:hypothetical protein